MTPIDTMIQWMRDKQEAEVTYSMISRNGPSSYDCSSAGYYALKHAGFFPAEMRIGNTDSMFRDFELNGWTKVQPDASGNFPTKRGDAAIWGIRGASSGSLGHFMFFTDADDVIHCNAYYNGIHVNNYDALAKANGWPTATFYRYTGASTPTTPALSTGDPTDQNVDVGSWIEFADNLTVNDVQPIGGVWQVKTDSLCPKDFTWDDNGIPAEPLVEVDGDGYATSDQNLNAGSQYRLPGKYQVLDLGLTDGHWMALIQWNGLKFWVDIASATEVSGSDGGTTTPGARPAAPVAPVPTVPEVPAEPVPEAPVITTPTPIEEINEVKETPMAFTEAQQKELAVAQLKAQDIADDVAASGTVQDLVSGISKKFKITVYIIGDSLIGLGLISPSLAVVAGWTDVVRVVALSSVLATAGAFILTMFGIYQSKK